MGSLALNRVIQHLDEGFELAGEGWGKVVEEPAPDFPLLECPEVIAGDDSQVVSGALQSPP